MLTGATKLPAILKKLIIPAKLIHSHNTRNQNSVYEVRPRRPIGDRLLKCNASKKWNQLPKSITLLDNHGEFKNEFYNLKLSSYGDSTLNFAPNMYWSQKNLIFICPSCYTIKPVRFCCPSILAITFFIAFTNLNHIFIFCSFFLLFFIFTLDPTG